MEVTTRQRSQTVLALRKGKREKATTDRNDGIGRRIRLPAYPPITSNNFTSSNSLVFSCFPRSTELRLHPSLGTRQSRCLNRDRVCLLSRRMGFGGLSEARGVAGVGVSQTVVPYGGGCSQQPPHQCLAIENRSSLSTSLLSCLLFSAGLVWDKCFHSIAHGR